MTRVLRLRSRVSAVATAAAVAVLVGAVAAQAAGIPRPPGGTDGRGYELVNIPDKNQQQANAGALLSADGNRALYAISGGSSASVTGVGAWLLAARTDAGWRSTVVTPPLGEAIGDYYSIDAVNPDLSEYIAAAASGSFSTLSAPTFVRLDDTGHQTVLATLTKPATGFGQSGDLGASENLEHIYGATDEKLDPDQVDGTYAVFDFAGGSPVLISRLPDGTVPACGVAPLGNTDGYLSTAVDPTVSQHRISRDGRYTYFVSRGNGCGDPKEMYSYDAETGRTELISGPVTSGPDLGTDRFLQAAADGSWVVFRSDTSYDAADTNGAPDVYRWTRGSGLSCLTCVVSNANVWPVDGFYPNVAVSEDGSHVYFVSPEQINGEGVAGERNLYVLRADRSTHYIGPVDGITYAPIDGGELTPDGNVLFFLATRAGLNALTGSDNGGNLQAYRYDDRDQSLTCVSCPASGPARSYMAQYLHDSAAVLIDASRAMTDDGSRLFFVTSDRLVTSDVNDSWDIYEWHDGEVGLITDGVMPNVFQQTQPRIIGVSRDGRDLLFRSFTRLTDEVQDQSENVYDARIGGGFEPPPSPPAPCAGDACQGLPSGPPQLGALGSALLTTGDQLSESPRRRGHVHASAVRSATSSGRALLSVRVDMAGRVSVVARAHIGGGLRRVGSASRRVTRAGKVQLRLRLSRAARARLAQAGRLRLSVDVTFSRAPEPQHLTLVLRVPATANGR